jgi:predicted dehydrogenase
VSPAAVSADRPVRWGILGAGHIAGVVGADIAASPGSELAAVAARDGARAAAFARAYGIARSYGSYAELAADPDVDVVYIATTHGQHHDPTILVLDAGKPVLVEKAFALNAREAREMVAAARANGVFCMEAMWLRLNPLVRHAVTLVGDGVIGELVSVRADLSKRFAYDPTSRLFDLSVGGGALLDLGVYPATFAWLFLGRPDRVDATGSLAPSGSDLTVAMQWGYRDGRVAQLYCSAAANSPYTGLVCGTQGWLRFETRLHRPSALTVHTGDQAPADTVSDDLGPASEQRIEAPPERGNGYEHEVAEVERCLRAGELESPSVPLADTVGVLEVLDEVRAQVGVRYPEDRPGG